MGRPAKLASGAAECGTTEGKPRGYWRGCRCAECVEARRAYHREYERRKRRARGARQNAREPEHGTLTMHRKGCRCEPCKEAYRAYQREYHRKYYRRVVSPDSDLIRVSSERVKPLLDCMRNFGISRHRVAVAAEIAPKLFYGKRCETTLRTARAVERLHWDLLWKRHAPFRAHCSCTVPEEVTEWLLGEEAG